MAIPFVRADTKVVLTDIDPGEQSAVILRAEGNDARYMHIDVTSEQNWAQVADTVMATHGRLDIQFSTTRHQFPRQGRGHRRRHPELKQGRHTPRAGDEECGVARAAGRPTAPFKATRPSQRLTWFGLVFA